jgi:hypothetical protein
VTHDLPFTNWNRTHAPWFYRQAQYHSATVLNYVMWNVGYQIKVYSDFEYYVGLNSVKSDTGGPDIRLSQITLITDIALSAHLSRLPRLLHLIH